MSSDQRSTSLSLLARLRESDEEAWQEFHACYGPIIRQWLVARGMHANDADDVEQEIMQVALRELPSFEHSGRVGALRNWLKQVLANRLRTHWRQKNRQAMPYGGSDYGQWAEQLADPSSQLSGLWDREFQQAVCGQLLALVSQQFQPQTVEAFRQVALLGRPPVEVAIELGITPNAVRIAQSRVLQKMRELGAGMLD
jgi:RNA polymerase sigma factor (sigma-70 family)